MFSVVNVIKEFFGKGNFEGCKVRVVGDNAGIVPCFREVE